MHLSDPSSSHRLWESIPFSYQRSEAFRSFPFPLLPVEMDRKTNPHSTTCRVRSGGTEGHISPSSPHSMAQAKIMRNRLQATGCRLRKILSKHQSVTRSVSQSVGHGSGLWMEWYSSSVLVSCIWIGEGLCSALLCSTLFYLILLCFALQSDEEDEEEDEMRDGGWGMGDESEERGGVYA